ncbi:MAG TPA: hypothetical protein VF579_05995, partial [Candidatus Methylomirabilis sp.]
NIQCGYLREDLPGKKTPSKADGAAWKPVQGGGSVTPDLKPLDAGPPAQLELRPDLFEAEKALGSLLARSGRGGEATRHLLRSAKIRPDRAHPFRALAMLAEERGDRPESLRLWRVVLRMAPNSAAVREAAEQIRRLGREDTGASPEHPAHPRTSGS